MSTYLVTGGAGFIGSNLCEALLKDGHTVRVLDNFSTGKKENLQKGVELFEADMRNLEAIRPAFEGVDGVFHCAAIPRVTYSIEHPAETTEINIMGTLNVLLASRDAKVKRLVYSASSSAYGNQETFPQHLGLLPKPLSPYGLQKYVGEHLARLFAELYGLETVSLRYFNVYGPRMADEGAYVTVMSIFIRQRKAGETLTIDGDGEQSRDFTHVTDIVRANMLAMTTTKAGKGEVVNVGAGQSHTVNEVAAIVGGPVVHRPPRLGDPRRSLADATLTKELLGWEPTVKFEDGVRELVRSSGLEPVA